MWPVLLDMTRDECKRVLRRLELEAYSSVVSAFRAQGDLTKDKKKILQNLQNMLSISTERHRAEVRRAVNDEKLATIADSMFGPNTTAEWLIEGRRLVPLMPRLVPQTAFTATANQAANLQAEKNASYPSPCLTSNKDLSQAPPASVTTPTMTSSVNKISRPSSPGSNVVVLPSGMSIHIKGGLNTEEDEELQTRKRRRSQSTESIVSPSASTQTPRVTYTTTAPSSLPGMSPVKITISKSPQARPQVTTATGQPQKVIIVSNASQTSTSNILHRSVTVPVIKSSTSSFSAANPNKTSIIYPNTANGNLGNIVTVATSAATQAIPTVTTSNTMLGTVSNTFLTPTMTLAKPRTKIIPRQKFTQQQQQKPGVVIPMGPQPVHASPSQNIQIKTLPKSTPTIQIKQEGGMKIITQSLPAGTSKILPKPSQLNAHGTPVVVVSGGSSGASTSTVTMVTRPISTVSGAQPGTKILNITQGGKVISTTSSKSPNVLTVNPKTLHLTAVRTPGGVTGGKPNVIVVQKAQTKALQNIAAGTSGATKITTTGNVTPFERELVSFLEKQDSTKRIRVTTAPGSGQAFEKKVIITTPMLSEAAKQKAKSESDDRKSSLLAELIQAAGILPEGTTAESVGGEVAVSMDESAAAAAALTAPSQPETVAQTKIDMSQPVSGNEWFEYDVGDEQSQSFSSDSSTATAIQSILDPPTTTPQRITLQRSSSLDLSQLSEHLSQQQFYTIEQAMRLVNQAEREEVQVAVPATVPTPSTSGAISLLHVNSPDSIQSQPPTQVQSSALGIESDSQESQNTTLSNVTTSSSGGDIEHIEPGITQELLGELDPETGLFSNNANRTRRIITIGGKVAVQTENSSAMPKNLDLLSSSLAQAQIDLDPYQFIEEIGGFPQNKPETEEQNLEASQEETKTDTEIIQPVTEPEVEVEKEVAIVTEEVTSSNIVEEGEVTMTTENELPTAIEETVLPEEIIKPVQETEPPVAVVPNTFIPLEDLGKTTQSPTITIKTHPQPAVSDTGDSVHVAVEPSSTNPDQMKIEDFASQQVQDKGDYSVEPFDDTEKSELPMPEEFQPLCSPATGTGTGSGSDSQGDNSCDPNHPTRVSSRKRRAPASIDDDFPQTVGGWARSAMGLLQRICRYRGLHKEKGEMGAAAWFTQPVDPTEAPDYYMIVKKPMDFGTIRKKLESGQYQDYDQFHSDMLQVRKNCLLYNPPSSAVRQDCDDVFNFYVQEYEKLVERWQKNYVSSPKKSRLDKSPVRP